MRTLTDGKQVSDSSYYFLLAFNDKDNKETMIEMFGKDSLNQLSLFEYLQLFKHVAELEAESMFDSIGFITKDN